MALTVADIVARLRAEGANQVRSEMRSAQSATDDYVASAERGSAQTQSFGKNATRLGSQLTGAGKALTLGMTVPLAGATFAMVNSASDLNEATTAASKTYGTASSEIIRYSQDSAQAVGLSSEQYLSAATQIGVFGAGAELTGAELVKFGNETIGAAADMASFYNAPVPEALDAIRAGLTGETEPLRRFGIMMNEAAIEQQALADGIWDGTGAMTEQQKILARQNFIMDNLGMATGDFADTSDGLANSQRILRAELANLSAEMGQALLPMATKVIGGLRGLISFFADLSPAAQRLTLIIGGVLAAIAPMLIVVGTIISSVGTIASAFGAGGFLAGFGAILGPIALVVAALVGLGIAYKTNFLGFGDAVRSVAGAVGSAFGAISGFIGDVVRWFGILNATTNPVSAALGAVSMALKAIGGENTPAWLVAIANGFDTAAAFVTKLVTAFGVFRASGLNPVAAAFAALRAVIYQVFGGENIASRWVKTILSGLNAAAVTAQRFGQRFTGVINKVKDALSDIGDAFGAGGILGGLRAIFGGEGLQLISAFGDALAIPSKAAGDFLKNFTTGFAPLDRMIRNLGILMTDFGRLIQEVFQGDFGGALAVGRRLLGNFADFMDSVFTGIPQIVAALFNAIPWGAIGGVLRAGFTTAMNSLQTLGTAAVMWLVNAFQAIEWGALIGGVISGAGDLASAIASRLGTFLSGLWQGITSIDWGALIPSFSWSDFVTVLSWAGKVTSLVWSKFVEGVVNLADWLVELDWANFVSGAVDVSTMIVEWTWDKIITGAVAVGDYITSWNWKSLITGVVDVASYITSLDWGKWVSGAVDVASMIVAWTWDKVISGAINVADYIVNLPWNAFITGSVDVAKYIVSWTWDKIISGTVNVIDYIKSLDWSSFVDKLTWPEITWPGWLGNFIDKLSWPSIGSFGAWADYVPNPFANLSLPEFSWPTPSEIASAIADAVKGQFGGGDGGGGDSETGTYTTENEPIGVQAKRGGGAPDWAGIKGPDTAALSEAGRVASSVALAFTNAATVVTNAVLAMSSLISSQFPAMATVITNTVRAAQSLIGVSFPAMATVVTNTTAALSSAATARFSAMASSTTNIVLAMTSMVRSQFSAMTGTATTIIAALTSMVRSQFSAMAATATNIVLALTSMVRSQFSQMSSAASSAVAQMSAAIRAGFQQAAQAATSAMQQAAQGVRSGMSQAVAAAQSGAAQIRGAILGIGNMFGPGFNIGQSLGQGISAGIGSMIGSVAAQAANMVRQAEFAARAEAASRSPSRKFMALGRDLGLGAVIGVREMIQPLARMSASLAETSIDAFGQRAFEPLRASVSGTSYQPMPVPSSRIGGTGGGGNVFVVMTRSELAALFETVDTVQVLTSPNEVSAAWGRVA